MFELYTFSDNLSINIASTSKEWEILGIKPKLRVRLNVGFRHKSRNWCNDWASTLVERSGIPMVQKSGLSGLTKLEMYHHSKRCTKTKTYMVRTMKQPLTVWIDGGHFCYKTSQDKFLTHLKRNHYFLTDEVLQGVISKGTIGSLCDFSGKFAFNKVKKNATDEYHWYFDKAVRKRSYSHSSNVVIY